jgi:hypothetical protein
MLSVVMLNVIMLSVIVLNVTMVSVVMLNVIMVSVVMLNAMPPKISIYITARLFSCKFKNLAQAKCRMLRLYK